MIKNIIDFFRKHRFFSQFLIAISTNIKLQNFLKGRIYTGNFKIICLPGLNCYSCPAAIGSCPIGSFQAVVGSRKFNFSYYVTGIMIFFGVLIGRLICGFLCPFGFFQDILHKIPTKKISTEKFKFSKNLKFFFLVVVVFLLGIFLKNKNGLSDPYFCKYVCPQGILEGGIPLSIVDISIRKTLGNLFALKFVILAIIIILSVFIYRPFCKFICPLGAFYGLFNKISFYRYSVDYQKCIKCKKCKNICDMDVYMSETQDNIECIRCGKCIDICPTNAIHTGILKENIYITKGNLIKNEKNL